VNLVLDRVKTKHVRSNNNTNKIVHTPLHSTEVFQKLIVLRKSIKLRLLGSLIFRFYASFFIHFLCGLSAYASGSTSAGWLIVLSPYWTFQLSPPVPRCHAPRAEKAGIVSL
jgi:hypothetical protein